MKIRHLLVVAVAAAAVADVSAFEWNPSIQQPNLNIDVTQAYQLETMRIAADTGLATTDVMPKYVDENGNEILGSVNEFSDPAWGDYVYDFNLADFKANGEYTIVFPEGMLKNAAGELSDAKEYYVTVEVQELAAAMFDDFEVLSVSPDFSEAQGIWDEQPIKINTNHNDAIGYTKLQVKDITTGESVTVSTNFTVGRKLGTTSEISWTVGGTFKFYLEHQYTAEFIFYNGPDEYSQDGFPTPVVARKTYKFEGKVEEYSYSDITLLSISPAPLTTTISDPSQAVFTYTFSGPVNVYKAETPMGQFGTTEYPESCLSSNDDKTVWTLNLSDNDYVKTVDAELVIYVYARDLDGSQLEGDFGEGTNSCFVGQWLCDIGGKSIVVASPKNGETLDSLSEIVVKSESGEEMTYNWGDMTIQNLLGEVLGTLVYDGDGGASTEFHFTKWIVGDSWEAEPLNIVDEGSYVINFPTGCFVFGEQFSSSNSRSLYSGFQISGTQEPPVGPGVDPAEQEVFKYVGVYPQEGSNVTSLDVIKIWFPEEVACEEFEVNVYNADKTFVTKGTGLYDWDDLNLVVVTLADPIKEEGKYEVVIPSRVIGNPEFLESDGKAGICNPEIRLNYSISKGSSSSAEEALEYSSVFPEEGSELESISQIVLTFKEQVTCDDFVVNVYSVARDGVVATGVGRTDYMDVNRIVLDFKDPITEAGRYEIVVPNHVIINGDYYESNGASGLCNPEYRLYYSVSGQTQVDPIDPAEQEVFNYTSVDPEAGSTVSELSHISLWFPELVNTLDDTAYVYKADAADAEPLTKASVLWDFMDDLLINIDLQTPITEDGDYVVVIPARIICDTEFFDSDGAKGICNPEIRLNYTVSGQGSVNIISAGSVCDIYDVQGRLVLHNASATDIKTLEKGIYVAGGKKFVVR